MVRWISILLAVGLGLATACDEAAPSHPMKRYALSDGFAYVEESEGGREGVSLTVLKGKPSLVALYEKDKAHGKVLAFDEEGRPQEMTTFNQGVLEGEWRCWNRAGERIEWGQFRGNKMHGEWTVGKSVSVYEAGKLMSGDVVNFDTLCGRGIQR